LTTFEGSRPKGSWTTRRSRRS